MPSPTGRAPIALGPFDLHAVIGSGGMAEVWGGSHRAEGAAVAVKVLTGERARTPLFERAFRREVQAVAGLDHPGVVMVLDYGMIDAAIAEGSGGRLAAGSPYLIMELASGGTLRRALKHGDRTWSVIKGALLTLLDALAHAHARGVVHRDVKPANILWFGDSGVRPGGDPSGGWKLTDFGLAHALEGAWTRSLELSCGTPAYMAPEQIQGAWRDYGPWTDLYGLGVVAYEMTAGHRPYQGRSSMKIFEQHLQAGIPRMIPTLQVPVGFLPWIERLLQKDHRDRFQRAADAAWALLCMGEPPADETGQHQRPWGSSGQVDTIPIIELPDDDDEESLSPPKHSAITRPVDGNDDPLKPPSRGITVRLPRPAPNSLPEITPPPIPSTWRSLSRPPRPQALRGAGLGLFGLRAIPMVGREAERDLLWEALRRAVQRRRPGAVLLTGVRGVGKSRLAEWLCQRAHEVGAATPLRVTHNPNGGSSLGRAMARHMGCARLDREALIGHVRAWLHDHGIADAWDLMALVELMSDLDEAPPTQEIRALRASERCGSIIRALEQVAARRPVILWLDDAHWSQEALTLARLALATQGPAGLLVLMTAQDDALHDLPEARRQLDALARDPACLPLAVEPLDSGSQRALASAMLDLDPALVERLVLRSEGHPLFIIQLVEDGVQRGLLRPSPLGFVLDPELGEQDLPESLHRLWQARAARLLEGRSRHDRLSLEVAAVLGLEVLDGEWREACARALLKPDAALIDHMVDRRLARWADGGWAFIHGMLRESLLQTARNGDRLPTHHRACAEVLIARHGHGRSAVIERIARHLLAAGDLRRGAEAMAEAVEVRCQLGELEDALALLNLHEDALARLALPEDDPQHGTLWMLRARACRMLGRFEEARDWAERLESEALRHGWRAVRAQGLTEQAYLASQRGRLGRARKIFSLAVSIFEELDHDVGMAEGMLGIGGVAYRQGDIRRALACYTQALSRLEELDHPEGIARTLRGLAEIALIEERWPDALALFERAMGLHEHLGNRFLWATCINGVAEVHRLRGELALAEEGYHSALTILEAMGSLEVHVIRLNIAMIQLARRRFPEARQTLTRARADLEAIGQDMLLAAVHAMLMACAAHIEDWGAFNSHLKQADALMTASQGADPDDAIAIHQAADMALAAGKLPQARAAFTLAMTLWSTLGRHDRVADIQSALRQIAGTPTPDSLP